MTVTIDQPTYSYIPGGVVQVGATLTVTDSKGASVSTGLSASKFLTDATWKQDLHADLVAQAKEYINRYTSLLTGIIQVFPGASTFGEAASQLIDGVRNEVING